MTRFLLNVFHAPFLRTSASNWRQTCGNLTMMPNDAGDDDADGADADAGLSLGVPWRLCDSDRFDYGVGSNYAKKANALYYR